MEIYDHGEAYLMRVGNIPAGAKMIKSKEGMYIIAPSEVTGNHHVVDAADDVTVYEHDGTLYMRNTGPASVRCLIKERHDTIEIPPGEWEIGIQKEYDPFTARSRNVAD